MKKVTLLAIPLMSLGLVWSSSAFAATDGQDPVPATRDTPVSAELQVSDGSNPMPPHPGTNGPNPDQGPSGNFGISYVPIKFSTAATKLNDSGEQKIAFAPNSTGEKFHVGVKDKTRDTYGWQLQATFTAGTDAATSIPGTSIVFENGADKVKRNDGTSTNATLNNLTSDEENGFYIGAGPTTTTPPAKVTLTNGNTVGIFGAKGQVTYNGVYDYELGQPSLVIADTQPIKAGKYTGVGTVNWNLVLAAPVTPNP